MPSEAADAEAPGQARIADHYANASEDALAREREHADDESGSGTQSQARNTPLPPESPTPPNGTKEKEKEKDKEKKPAAKGPKPFDQAEREEMENLLNELRGHLGTSCLVMCEIECAHERCSAVSHSIPRGRGCREQLLVPV